jgi:hypothetical protein
MISAWVGCSESDFPVVFLCRRGQINESAYSTNSSPCRNREKGVATGIIGVRRQMGCMIRFFVYRQIYDYMSKKGVLHRGERSK